MLDNLALGLQVAFTLSNLFYCALGVLVGTLIGVLPGIGPAGTIALLLPITYGIHPVSAIILLSGVYYGAMYGGSTASVLVNIPGEAASVVTCIDGYQMARQGRAGPALGIAAFGSFIAGTIGIAMVMVVAEPLADFAVRFGPPELFALIVLALTLSTYLAHGSMMKAMIMATFGLALSQIGQDLITGQVRFTFGVTNLQDGIGLIPLVMGLFGISEVFINLEESMDLKIFKEKIKNLLPNSKDWRDSIGAILRGTFLGFFLGILPGGGGVMASFASYALEKKISKHPERFGTGVIEGVAGPESANNSGTAGAFVPLFTLGLPSNAVTALLLGALMIHGLRPGPLLIKEHPEVFWGTIMSLYLGNLFLLILNLPLIGIWVILLKVPYRILFPAILLLCLIGSYSVNYSNFDLLVLLIFGLVGYVLKKYQYEPAPLIMAFILGPMMENSLRQALIMSGGHFNIFITRSIPAVSFMITLFLLGSNFFLKKRRERS